MLSEKETARISKFLSLVLRHQPELIGLTLDGGGWAAVSDLLQKMAANNYEIDFASLQRLVATNNKKRFAFNDDETKIRANQGHSITVELGYGSSIPPTVLYHGTSEKNVAAILQYGLQKQRRHHVHLSADEETALKVGQRHGKPALLEVAAGDMHKQGYEFFVSANGVWLTDHVPPQYLKPRTK